MDRPGGSNASEQRPAPSTFFVVEDGTGTKKGRSKQSRAHVARVNRQRQKLKATDAAAAQHARASATASSNAWNDQLPARPAQPEARSHSENHVVQTIGRRNNTAAAAWLEARRTRSAPTVPQTIQPIFGATNINSFPKEHSLEAAETAKFCFERVMDSWLNPMYKPAWIAAFFQHPIVYHCLSFATGVMQDFTLGRPISLRRLWHRGMTISLVNDALGNLDDVDIEPVLLAISSLWRINTEILAERREVSVLFLPHVRNLNWVNVFGKLGTDTGHGQALAQLVHRKGGLEGFTTLPSLQESLALADLLDSSCSGTRPRFPRLWSLDHFLQALAPALQFVASDKEGTAFKNPSLHIPDDCRAAYQRLADVDKMLDDFTQRTVSHAEDFWIGELSSAVQHELLSLSPWVQLGPTDRGLTTEATYEACRITAILYSNAVVFPISPSEAWLDKLLIELRQLLEREDAILQDQASVPLLIWTAFITSMAAYWTPHCMFFTNLLSETLRSSGLTSWGRLQPLLREFLWRDNACEPGAATLWKFLDIEQAVDT